MNREEAIASIDKSGLDTHFELLVSNLAPSARIVIQETQDGSSAVASHFGGLPSLPTDATWPLWDKRIYLQSEIARAEERFKANPRAIGWREVAARLRLELSNDSTPLLFVGQLYLNEISAIAPLPGLPHDGSLAFFCDPSTWGFDPLAQGHCRVLYLRADEKLTPVAAPKSLSEESRFPERKLHFKREWTLPTNIRAGGVELSVWDNDGRYQALCSQLLDGPDEGGPIHRCGGHPQEIQGDMRLECQLVTNGIYCGDQSGYQDPRRLVLEKGVSDWRLLLQIDSDEKRCGWMWGDSGRIYFWIRQQDIETADFDGSWSILQCY